MEEVLLEGIEQKKSRVYFWTEKKGIALEAHKVEDV